MTALSTTQLDIHEWCAIILLSGLMIALALVAKIQVEPPESSPPVDGLISAEIEGAVLYPGIYHFQAGASLLDLLQAGEPLPEADLRGIRKKGRLKNGQLLAIKELPSIQIQVVGAVKDTKPIQVPTGTRLVDLLGLVAFQKDADLETLKKRRRLKDGETVVVPSRSGR